MAFSNVLILVSIREIPIPTISSTSARNPEPLVPVSSKSVVSPTLYPVPPFKMVNPSTPPLVTASIFEICLIFSYDSITKSLPANFSSTLYGKVFLLNPELLKSKSWFSIWFSAMNGER